MAARLFQRDLSGVPRKWARPGFRDAGGVTRMLKRMFIRDVFGVARQVFQGFWFNGSIVAGEVITSNPGCGSSSAIGFEAGAAIGSISGGGATIDGHTIVGLVQILNTDGFGDITQQNFILQVNGFTSNPGAGYISALVFGGVTFTSASATYSYNSGNAIWAWVSATVVFGTTYPVVLLP